MKCEMEFENSVLRVFIHLLSIFLNGAILRVLVQKSLFRCPSNRFVLSLAASHLVFSLLTLLVSLSTFIDTFSLCLLTGQVNVYNVIFFGAFIHNSLLMTGISIERYITIAKPMRYKSIVTTQRISLIIVSLWILSTIVTIIPLIVPHQNGHHPVLPFSPYFAIVFSIVTMICFLMMSVCYYIIFTIAKEKCQNVQIGQFTSSISSDWPSSAYPSEPCQKPASLLQHVLKVNSFRLQKLEEIRQRRSSQNSPRKTIATILAILGSLIFTQLPISLTLYSPDLWSWASLMLMLSSISNPVLYGLLNRKIRLELWKILRVYKKPKRPDCCCMNNNNNKHPSICSDIIKEMGKEPGQVHCHQSHYHHVHSHSYSHSHSHSHSDLHLHSHALDRELLSTERDSDRKKNDIVISVHSNPEKNHLDNNTVKVQINTKDKENLEMDQTKEEVEEEEVACEENERNEKMEVIDLSQLADSTIQFPRKDSQDSGADMTFSDEEEEGAIPCVGKSRKSSSVFCDTKSNLEKKPNARDGDGDGDGDDDQPSQQV